MAVRNVGRAALSGWLKVTRLPVDAAVRALPNGDKGPRNSVMLVIDRFDATVRETIGGLVGDEELRADAHRRRVAADEREHAAELRVAAKDKKRAADAQLSERQDAAERRRHDAQRTAQQRKQAANKQRVERERSAKQMAAKQRHTVEQARQDKTAKADNQAKRRRLDVLDDEATALDQKNKALTAGDEAKRLRNAASRAKAARKRNASKS